jgi:predicted enzyme related to lactoylglutathione lyase
MINAVHMLIYSEDPAADRAFLRDVLGYSYVDTGHDWLIFKLPPAEAGVHPADQGGGVEMYFMCDDLDSTLADLAEHGVEPIKPVSKRDYGAETTIRLPGGGVVGLYQPFHPVAYDL